MFKYSLYLLVIKMGSIMSPKVPTKARTTASTKTTYRHSTYTVVTFGIQAVGFYIIFLEVLLEVLNMLVFFIRFDKVVSLILKD